MKSSETMHYYVSNEYKEIYLMALDPYFIGQNCHNRWQQPQFSIGCPGNQKARGSKYNP